MIQNTNNKKVIVEKTKLCKTVFSKTTGLMFSRKIKDKGLVFFFEKEQKIPLHMFFVFYPIDVLFLDNEKQVVEIKENFKPFTFYTNKKHAMYIIELPKGSINKSNTKIGNKISF